MVLAQRLDYVRKMILAGHDVHFAQGLSCHTGRIKIKIKIGSAGNIVPTALRPLLQASLDLFADAAENHVAVDRGHNFSKGHAFVHLWLTPVQPGVSATIGVEEDDAPMAGTVTPVGHAEVDEATDEEEGEVGRSSCLPPPPPPVADEALVEALRRLPCPPPPPPPRNCGAMDRAEVAGLRACLLPPQSPCPPPPPPLMPPPRCPPPPPWTGPK